MAQSRSLLEQISAGLYWFTALLIGTHSVLISTLNLFSESANAIVLERCLLWLIDFIIYQ